MLFQFCSRFLPIISREKTINFYFKKANTFSDFGKKNVKNHCFCVPEPSQTIGWGFASCPRRLGHSFASSHPLWVPLENKGIYIKKGTNIDLSNIVYSITRLPSSQENRASQHMFWYTYKRCTDGSVQRYRARRAVILSLFQSVSCEMLDFRGEGLTTKGMIWTGCKFVTFPIGFVWNVGLSGQRIDY